MCAQEAFDFFKNSFTHYNSSSTNNTSQSTNKRLEGQALREKEHGNKDIFFSFSSKFDIKSTEHVKTIFILDFDFDFSSSTCATKHVLRRIAPLTPSYLLTLFKTGGWGWGDATSFYLFSSCSSRIFFSPQLLMNGKN